MMDKQYDVVALNPAFRADVVDMSGDRVIVARIEHPTLGNIDMLLPRMKAYFMVKQLSDCLLMMAPPASTAEN